MSAITQNHLSETREVKGGGDLAEGWTSVLLPEICSVNPPKPPADTLPSGELVTFVPMPAVDAEAGAITRPETRPFSKVRKGFTAFQDGDVILAKITPCMENGKAAVARNLLNGLGFGSTEFHVLRSNGAVLPEFIYHFIRQESFRKAAESEMTGSVGQKRVPADFLRQTEFPLAPLAEQKRIVAKIEELFTQVNAARARLAKVPQILKRFRQSVLAAACSGRLTADWRESRAKGREFAGLALVETDLPEGWNRVELGKIAELVSGVGFPKKHQNRQGLAYPFFKVANLGEVASGALLTESKHTIDDELVRELRARVLPPGSIAFAKIGMAIALNRRRQLARPACIDNNMMAAIPTDAVLPSYLLRFLETVDFMPLTQATTVPSIRKSSLAELPVPLPPKDEQREIVRRVEALLRFADAVEKRVEAATKRADKLTQAILAKAFRGELVPTEAELARREGRDYEPASALLARIKAERLATTDAQRSSRRNIKLAGAARMRVHY